jgi:transcriptional regulator with XRE-family HTH domain
MFGKNLVLPNFEGIRAARGYIGWSQTELANKVGLNLSSITKIETGQQHPTKENLDKIAGVFLSEGIKFHADGGFVKLEKEVIKVFEGPDGYLKVLEDILETCGPKKSEFLLLGADDKRSSNKVNQMYVKMYELGITSKTLIDKDNDYILGDISTYRKVNKDLFFSNDVVVIYENKVMFFVQKEDNSNFEYSKNVKNLIIKDKELAETFRKYFYRLWGKAEKVDKSSQKRIF